MSAHTNNNFARQWAPLAVLFLVVVSMTARALAEPNLMGQSGLIAMPDARVAPDGTWRIGVSNSNPYLSGWTSLSLLPRMEFSGRYTSIADVPAFGTGTSQTSSFGDDKDKSFDLKLLAVKESDRLPALALGTQDFLGTRLFGAEYLVLSKRVGTLDLSLGVGNGRIDGAFGGVRFAPKSQPNLALVAEYDANAYRKDPSATLSGAADRPKGVSVGVEYTWFRWLHTQASWQNGNAGLLAYISIPLNRREFVPKLHEPAPYDKVIPRPSLEQWLDDPSQRRRLIGELEQQDFKSIHVTTRGNTLMVTLTNSRISLMSRAIGRAARTILLLAPVETREIRITYTSADLPVATYTFFELGKLRDYFAKKITREELVEYVSIEYAEAGAPTGRLAASPASPAVSRVTTDNDEGDFISYRRESGLLDKVKIAPKAAFYFNDPSGFLHYELFARATYDKHLADKLFFSAAADLTLLEDVSKVTQASNSQLPHVRTDIADYKKDSKLKLSRLLLNRYYHVDTGIYARASAGLYEQMFAGAGGQVLYAAKNGQWATDLSVDWLQQRDTHGGFGFRSYSTVTAVAALHYKLPMNMTGTLRAGRFLAKDDGVRLELKRRFQSGFEMGAWYTYTNGNDITSPGSPSSPYHDKGIFLSMPFDTLLTRDTQAKGTFSLAPWTRDVGQMVASPGDLYELLEKPLLLDFHARDGLVRLGDREDDYALPEPKPPPLLDRPISQTIERDLSQTGKTLTSRTTWRALALGVGVTVLSSVLDKPVDTQMKKYTGNRYSGKIADVGNALPLLGLAASGVLALHPTDTRLNTTAYIALQAGLAAGLTSEIGKRAVGRSRPKDGLGNTDFHAFDTDRGDSAFPSAHSAVIWATLTPYAKEYEMPWLYGLAGLTNLGRIAGREHWVSDTVGSSLLGYAIGSLMWNWQRDMDGNTPTVQLTPQGVDLTWKTE